MRLTCVAFVQVRPLSPGYAQSSGVTLLSANPGSSPCQLDGESHQSPRLVEAPAVWEPPGGHSEIFPRVRKSLSKWWRARTWHSAGLGPNPDSAVDFGWLLHLSKPQFTVCNLGMLTGCYEVKRRNCMYVQGHTSWHIASP